ncbi:polygalacturonase At1g48100-like [Hibiscus syriacus]|uniref:polygalacturonase At1g48100-like n=1 Tax=Hibiscus syriacus TaxID=106335 RepID=UPI0019220310|nr:polygalacturonase At1g48100-like [Hibiscus syriacus]
MSFQMYSNAMQAFRDAWMDACKVVNSAVLVPARFTFLVGPVSFDGSNCQPNIVFKLEGTIIAPDPRAWHNGTSQWIVFAKLNRGVTVTGRGIIDGRGLGWWNRKSTRPTALRFYGSSDVRVEGITIQNSPRCHLKFENCRGVEVKDVTASSPPDSPNTDGILLSNSMHVRIFSSNLACGDDCVSIIAGCSNVTVENVRCGPGHGISIGSLGEKETRECVSDIIVRNISIHNSTNGARIKTWQGGSGSVHNVQFSNINVSHVGRPIVINQFYCDVKDRKKCANKTASVAVSGITFRNIYGTYTVKPVDLACSDSVPCTGVNLNAIDLNPSTGKKPTLDNAPYCWKASGEMNLTTPTVPLSGGCSKTDKRLNKRVRPDRDVC